MSLGGGKSTGYPAGMGFESKEDMYDYVKKTDPMRYSALSGEPLAGTSMNTSGIVSGLMNGGTKRAGSGLRA